MEGTAVATRSTGDVIREGANLPLESWGDARVAAMLQLLPDGFRDTVSAIALMSRAMRAGLDPFTNEIYAWKGDGGKLTFHTGRDGWVKTAKKDEDIAGLEFGLIYEGDEFNWQQEGQRVKIDHRGGLSEGRVIGAYCVVHMVNMDHLERRTVNDYKHLANKSNWKNYLPEMLLTRTVVAAVKFCSPLGAGIDLPPEYAPDVYQTSEQGVEVVRRTDDKTHELGMDLATVVVTEPDGIGRDEPRLEDFPCPYCELRFPSGPAVGGHMGTHKAERELERQLADSGYKIQNEDGTYLVVEPTGAYHDIDPVSGKPWASWADAATWIQTEIHKEGGTREPVFDESPTAPPADAPDEEHDAWDREQGSV